MTEQLGKEDGSLRNSLYRNMQEEPNDRGKFSTLMIGWLNWGLTLPHTIPTFNDPRDEVFGKHSGKRRKCW